MLLAESLEASMTLNNGRHQNTEIFYFFIQYQFCGEHCQIFTINIFLYLVEAIHILLSESISKEAFQKGIIAFYGEQYQTFNAYSILHLVFCVRNIGLLWSFSCFSYEDYNGNL